MTEVIEQIKEKEIEQGKEKRNVPKLRFRGFEDEWTKYCFFDCVTIRNGQVSPLERPYCDMPHIGPGNIEKYTGRLLDYNTAKEDKQISGKYLFDEYDIIYGKINPQLGKVVFPQFKGLCSADAYPLKVNRNIMVSYFLFMYLQTQRFSKYTISVSMRSGMPKINREELGEFQFKVPSLQEQKKIADFFTLIDRKIEKQSEKVAALKTYKKGIMQKIFSREIRFKDENGREYPEWEEKRLGDIIELKSVRNSNNNVNFILSVSNSKGFICQDEQFEDRIVASSNVSNYKVVNKDDFAFNPSRINVGSIARLKYFEQGIVSPMYICFRCKSRLKNDFLEFFLDTYHFNAQVKNKLEGSVRQSLSSDSLCSIKINLPCLKEQVKIANFLTIINKKIEKEEKKLEKLKVYKKGLLQKMFV